jgi:hypothetical protein
MILCRPRKSRRRHCDAHHQLESYRRWPTYPQVPCQSVTYSTSWIRRNTRSATVDAGRVLERGALISQDCLRANGTKNGKPAFLPPRLGTSERSLGRPLSPRKRREREKLRHFKLTPMGDAPAEPWRSISGGYNSDLPDIGRRLR